MPPTSAREEICIPIEIENDLERFLANNHKFAIVTVLKALGLKSCDIDTQWDRYESWLM